MEKLVLDERYEIIEQIGVGGMAKVYKAKDRLLDRFVAIKVLKDQYAEDSEFLKKFNNEAQSAAKLSHVNIVNVFDIGEDLYKGQRIYYIVMEYVEGQTLKDLILSKGKLSNQEIIDYSVQIAKALRMAHNAGIIHRDIKPQNILIDNYGLLKVTDFGIARVSSNATITYTSSILGTVHYISPEQAKGNIVDEKSDLYSLGAVMYEMATGKVPFDADNSVGIALMHIQDEPISAKELNPDLSDHLNYIIMKLLKKEASERFLNARELIDALEDEDYIFDQEDLSETAPIPIVVPKDKVTSKVYQQNYEQEEVEKEKEAVYVSNPDKKNSSSKNKKAKKLWPLLLLALVLVSAVYFLRNRTSSKQIEVPTVLNLNQSQAINELERRGLKANISLTEESDEYEIGKVMRQDPSPNTKVDRGSQVNLVISKGREVEVPDLRNMTIAQAEEVLKEAGLRLGRTMTQKSDNVDKDLIISQDPRSYSKLQTGSEIDVTVSTGPDGRVETIEVPNVLGHTEQNARAILSQAGLALANVNYYNSDNTQQGLVMNQSIAAGTRVAKDSQIEISISTGPKEVTPEENNIKDVELRVEITEPKDQYYVEVYDIVNGQRGQSMYSGTQTHTEVENNGGVLIVNVKASVGAYLEIVVDGQSYGVTVVNQWLVKL